MAGKQEGLLAFGEVARSAGVCEERYATHSALLGRHGGRPSREFPLHLGIDTAASSRED